MNNLPDGQPVVFIANVGQLDAGVRFQVRGQHATLHEFVLEGGEEEGHLIFDFRFLIFDF